MASFQAPIKEAPRGGAYVEVPADVVAALGGKARIPVTATFDGIPYRGSIVPMGGLPMLGVLKDIRRQLGKSTGDHVTVSVEMDDAKRSVTIPDDMATALDAGGVRTVFEALAYTHQREYLTWIDDAKRPATRARRIAQTVDRLRP